MKTTTILMLIIAVSTSIAARADNNCYCLDAKDNTKAESSVNTRKECTTFCGQKGLTNYSYLAW